MLRLLTIADLGVIEYAEVPLNPGLNVLTGETGSGKSIIVDALGLLLGDRADAGFVRAGASRARVEGVFALDEAAQKSVAPLVAEVASDDAQDGELVLTREINRDGKNICRINGRLVPLKSLAALGECLADIHGQSQHLSLLRPSEHVEILDSYAGLTEQRGRVAQVVNTLLKVRRDLENLQQEDRDVARRTDLLRYQIDEITAADLHDGEDAELLKDKTVLANAEQLQTATGSAYRVLGEEDGGVTSVADLLGSVLQELTDVESLDPSLERPRELAASLTYQAEELAHTLRDYRDAIDDNPPRLQEIEERFAMIDQLRRKYGDTIQDILDFARQAEEELLVFSTSEQTQEELLEEEVELSKRLGDLVGRLSLERNNAAIRLAHAVEAELTELAMDGTRVCIDLQRVESDDGISLHNSTESSMVDSPRYAFTASGIDRIEFQIAPNLGEPLKPLAKIASGGEAARLMLAFKAVLSEDTRIPTLAFDEIDSGVGGRIGGVVGKKLSALSTGHQVLCVTHLPQVAAFADHHIRVSKAPVAGRTVVDVSLLQGDECIEELSQMLGGASMSTRRSAAEMLERAAAWKTGDVPETPRLVMIAS